MPAFPTPAPVIQTFYREKPFDLEDEPDEATSPTSRGEGEGSGIDVTSRDTIAETVQRRSYARGSREYIKSALVEHPLWQDMLFWDAVGTCALTPMPTPAPRISRPRPWRRTCCAHL